MVRLVSSDGLAFLMSAKTTRFEVRAQQTSYFNKLTFERSIVHVLSLNIMRLRSCQMEMTKFGLLSQVCRVWRNISIQNNSTFPNTSIQFTPCNTTQQIDSACMLVCQEYLTFPNDWFDHVKKILFLFPKFFEIMTLLLTYSYSLQTEATEDFLHSTLPELFHVANSPYYAGTPLYKLTDFGYYSRSVYFI